MDVSARQSNVLDPTYGKDGVAYPHPDITTVASSVPHGDGRICVGTHRDYLYALFRVDAKGLLDPDFGTSAGLTTGSFQTGFNADGRRVQLLSDGRILITGLHHTGLDSFPALARFSAQGILDKTFGDNGHTILQQPPVAAKGSNKETRFASQIAPDGQAVTLQDSQWQADLQTVAADDKIYVTYKFPWSNSVVFRLDRNGQPDNSFNGTGHKYLSPPLGLDTFAGAIHLESDKILLCGASTSGDTKFACVIRLLDSGLEDQTFGAGGYAFLDLADTEFNSIAVDSGQRIVCAGHTLTNRQKGVIAAFTADGKPDPRFKSRPIDFGHDGGSWVTIGLMGNGQIITVGSTFGGDEADVVIGRFEPEGTPDLNFGDGEGWARIALGDSIDLAFSGALLADDKTLVAGSDFDTQAGRKGFLLRCLTNPKPN